MNKLTPKFVDAHCHLDLYPDMERMMYQADGQGIATFAVTTTPRAWPRNREIARSLDLVWPALGLHPQLVGQFPDDIKVWDSYVHEAEIIGEVGLDASPAYYGSFESQKEMFAHILKSCAHSGNKILTIHSIRSAKTVLDMIEQNLGSAECTAILHWFTGSASEAKRAVDLGCYFSINGEMLKKQQHQNTVRLLPIDKLLTETDGPFTKIGSRPTVPNDVEKAVSALASTVGLPSAEIQETISKNYCALMNRHGLIDN